MNDITIYDPPIYQRATDKIADVFDEHGNAVSVLDARPYAEIYANPSGVGIMVEFASIRFFPNEARELAQRLLIAADYADSISNQKIAGVS